MEAAMTDLHERFHSEFDDVPIPDLWSRIERVAASETVTLPPPRSRALVAVAAAAVALVLVGGPLLLLASMDRTEPLTETLTTVPEPRALAEVDPPWRETVRAVTLVGDGGIVALADNPDRVFWSPNRVEWFDADPDRRVTPWYPRSLSQLEEPIIVSTNRHVAVRGEANDGVWIAAPETGQWQFIGFTGDEADDRTEQVLSLATNDTEVLVVTHTMSTGVVLPTGSEAPESIPYIHEYTGWLIDTNDGTIEPHALPLSASEWVENPMVIANWFNDQWLVAIHREVWTDTDEGWVTSTPIMTSSDGQNWTVIESDFPADSATSISVGPMGLVATECNFGGDSFWYSDDGISWEVTATNYMGHRSVYVDGLGFLTYYQGSPTAFSPDGQQWQTPVAGLTVLPFDGTADPDPADGNFFVADNHLMRWSINNPEARGDGTR
jgi:hypothetical protein